MAYTMLYTMVSKQTTRSRKEPAMYGITSHTPDLFYSANSNSKADYIATKMQLVDFNEISDAVNNTSFEQMIDDEIAAHWAPSAKSAADFALAAGYELGRKHVIKVSYTDIRKAYLRFLNSNGFQW
jgi:hypothetical protein